MKTPCSWQRGTKHTVLRCDMGRLALRYGAFCDAIRPVSHRFHLYIYLFYRHLADVLGNEALHYHCISTIDYLTIKPLRLHAHFRAICGQRLCSFAGRESRKPFVPRCLTFLTLITMWIGVLAAGALNPKNKPIRCGIAQMESVTAGKQSTRAAGHCRNIPSLPPCGL